VLHQLTEKGRKFEWTKECDTAFGTLKHFLVEAPILGYPMDRGDFIILFYSKLYFLKGALSARS
jgi:hypothetical protein